MVSPDQRDRILGKELTPHGESNTDHGAVPTFCAGFEGEFLGRPIREDAAGMGTGLGRRIGEGAGPGTGGGKLRAGGVGAAGIPQWVL